MVSRGENVRRSFPYRPLATHCKRGHEFTTKNTYIPPSAPTERHCRECKSERARRAVPPQKEIPDEECRRTEPVLTTASITAAVSAVIGVLVAFGVPLSDRRDRGDPDPPAGVIAPLIVIVARKWTWSDESHHADKARAIDETARAYGHEDA